VGWFGDPQVVPRLPHAEVGASVSGICTLSGSTLPLSCDHCTLDLQVTNGYREQSDKSQHNERSRHLKAIAGLAAFSTYPNLGAIIQLAEKSLSGLQITTLLYIRHIHTTPQGVPKSRPRPGCMSDRLYSSYTWTVSSKSGPSTRA
jgi:hypothetical protein